MFEAKIVEASAELSAKERVKYKDTGSLEKIDKALDEADSLIVKVKGYVVVDVHNDNPKAGQNPDYTNYVLITEDSAYVTGSTSFWNAFKGIWDELKDEEDWELLIRREKSKNYTGKYFITCSVL